MIRDRLFRNSLLVSLLVNITMLFLVAKFGSNQVVVLPSSQEMRLSIHIQHDKPAPKPKPKAAPKPKPKPKETPKPKPPTPKPIPPKPAIAKPIPQVAPKPAPKPPAPKPIPVAAPKPASHPAAVPKPAAHAAPAHHNAAPTSSAAPAAPAARRQTETTAANAPAPNLHASRRSDESSAPMALPRSSVATTMPAASTSPSVSRLRSNSSPTTVAMAVALPAGNRPGELAIASTAGLTPGLVGEAHGRRRGEESNGALAGAKTGGAGTLLASADIGGGDSGAGAGRGRGRASGLGLGLSSGNSIGLGLGAGGKGYGEGAGASGNDPADGNDIGNGGGTGGAGGHRGDHPSTPIGDGRGVTAQYYCGSNFETFAFTRIDPVIGFASIRHLKDPRLTMRWSARWSGYIQPLYSETYTFTAGSDDGSRIMIDGQEIINMWHDQPITYKSAQFPMMAGRMYKIIVEYYQNDMYPAEMELSWSSPHQPMGPIPTKQLFPL